MFTMIYSDTKMIFSPMTIHQQSQLKSKNMKRTVPLPQDNGDHATQAYYNSTQSAIEPVQSVPVPQSVPEPEPVPMPEPVRAEPIVQSVVPEPEPVVEEPVQEESEPVPEPEMVQQEEPEPVQAEPVPVPEVPIEQVQEEESKPVPVQQSNAPMSWAARMRSN